MGRFFSGLLLAALLLHVPARGAVPLARPVFFSMLFPQLMPSFDSDELKEAVRL